MNLKWFYFDRYDYFVVRGNDGYIVFVYWNFVWVNRGCVYNVKFVVFFFLNFEIL